MKITVSNCCILFDPGGWKTILWSIWRYVASSNSCWSYDQNFQRNPCAVCTILRCEVSRGGCCCHKNFLLLVVGPCYSACKLLICPSKLMHSNLPWSSPLCHLFSVSIVLVQSHRARLFCWVILPRMSLFYVCRGHQTVLGMERKSINILCPKSSTLQVKGLTVACVAVMLSSGRLLVSTQLHSHVIYIYIYIYTYTLIHHRVCKFLCWNIFISLDSTAWR